MASQAPRKSNKPTISERARARICPECGGAVTRRSAKGPFPTFCSKEHKRAYGNRLLAQGLPVIGLLKAWRIDRGTGEIAQKAFSQVCTILDEMNAEDARQGRVRPDLYASKLMANSGQYIDRQRPKGPRKAVEETPPEPAPDPLEEILRQIAAGHNDPRRIAEEALASRQA